jgi:hypothetical protein
MKYSHNLI